MSEVVLKNGPVRAFPEKQSLMLKCKTWNLWINRVLTKGGRIMFPLKVSEVSYDAKWKQFNYPALKEDPIWLSRHDLRDLASHLLALADQADKDVEETEQKKLP